MLRHLRTGIVAGLAAAAVLIGMSVPMVAATAQEAMAPSGGAGLFEPFLQGVLPMVVELFLSASFGLAGVVAFWLKQKWNVDIAAKLKDIEAHHREGLQSAIASAVADLLMRRAQPPHIPPPAITVGSPELLKIERAIAQSVPEAIELFKPSAEVVARIANKKLAELLAQQGTTMLSVPEAFEGPARY